MNSWLNYFDEYICDYHRLLYSWINNVSGIIQKLKFCLVFKNCGKNNSCGFQSPIAIIATFNKIRKESIEDVWRLSFTFFDVQLGTLRSQSELKEMDVWKMFGGATWGIPFRCVRLVENVDIASIDFHHFFKRMLVWFTEGIYVTQSGWWCQSGIKANGWLALDSRIRMDCAAKFKEQFTRFGVQPSPGNESEPFGCIWNDLICNLDSN